MVTVVVIVILGNYVSKDFKEEVLEFSVAPEVMHMPEDGAGNLLPGTYLLECCWRIFRRPTVCSREWEAYLIFRSL